MMRARWWFSTCARERRCGPRGSRSISACAVGDTLVHYQRVRDGLVHECLVVEGGEPMEREGATHMQRPMGTDSAPRAHNGHTGGRRSGRGRLLAALAVAAAGVCFPASAAAKYSVSLTRTTGGIANISGENFADVGFGIGYAQAQDGICLLA